jgi:ribosome recycling factor
MAFDFTKLKNNIKETEEWLTRELSGIRTGRASVALLDSIKPEVYGARTPLQQVGSLTVEDARSIRITAWDKENVKAIEKAITEADLGVSVSVDDAGLRVSFPELTLERRTMLSKLAGDKCEQARITLRGHRTDAMKELEASEKDGGMGEDELRRLKEELQKLIEQGQRTLEASLDKKQTEIAT